MKYLKKRLLLATLLFSVAALQQVHAEMVVIAHPDNPLLGISKEEVKDIYLGRTRSFPNGEHVEPVDHSAGTSQRDVFNRVVLEMSESKRKSHWSRLMFTGKARPPKVINGTDAMKQWIATHPDALGYIDSKEVDKRVKVLLILQ